MNAKDINLESEEVRSPEPLNLREFKLNPVSSAETIQTRIYAEDKDSLSLEVQPPRFLQENNLAEKAEDSAESEEDPIFKALSEPTLPELPRENRARLQMQSPNRLYFYWSLKSNPFQILQKVFGGRTDSYRLVVKLVKRGTEAEEIHPVEAEGNWWFNVDADSEYRAEIGFYATNRPYFRVLFSNTVETPRRSPSPRRDYSPDFMVNARKFAEVLKQSGFRQDAFEVALAGDDIDYADFATRKAFSRLTGNQSFVTADMSELRLVLLALASGYTLAELQSHISSTLFAFLQENLENLNVSKAISALRENFDFLEDEFVEEDEEAVTPMVFGASLINFPRKARKSRLPKKLFPKLKPVSS